MARLTKARRPNAAHQLLERDMELSEAAQNLAREYDLSLRPAYRYLDEAARLGQAVEVTEATVPVTLKLPPATVRLLRVREEQQADYWNDCR